MADSDEVYAELLKVWPGEWLCSSDFSYSRYEPHFLHAEYLPRTRLYRLVTRGVEIKAGSWAEAFSRLTDSLEEKVRHHERELRGVRALLEHVKARTRTP